MITQTYTNIKKNSSLRKDSNGIQKGRHISDQCTLTILNPLCSPPVAPHLRQVQYRVTRNVTRMHKMTTQVPETKCSYSLTITENIQGHFRCQLNICHTQKCLFQKALSLSFPHMDCHCSFSLLIQSLITPPPGNLGR